MRWPLALAGCVRTLVRYKLRTLFMSVGVTLGVAILIAGQSFGRGVERQILERVDQMFGPGTILIFSPTLRTADLEAIEDRLDQVVAWAPRFAVGTVEVSSFGIRRQVAVFGHSERGDVVWNRGAAEGRFITSADLSRTSRVALIGPKLADQLFVGTDPIGEEVMIGSAPFEVVGILEPIGIDPHGEDRDEDIIVPSTTAMRRLANTEIVGSAKIVVEDLERVDHDADEVAEMLRDLHRLAPGEKDDFAIFTSKLAGRTVVEARRAISRYLLIAAGIVLLVAAVVISTMMLGVVRDRVGEIGLRKAVGATEGQIAAQLLIETTLLTAFAGIAGIAFGMLVAQLAARYVHVSPEITSSSIALGLATVAIVGLGSGVLPARRAARLDPVDALR